jgi:hypothetical protein
MGHPKVFFGWVAAGDAIIFVAMQAVIQRAAALFPLNLI